MRKFNKNIAKEFKTSFGRFIAIMAIIALGVGFLIGGSFTSVVIFPMIIQSPPIKFYCLAPGRYVVK